MTNDLTPMPDSSPARKRLELPSFPIHKHNPDGTLVPLTDAQWRAVPTNISRLEGVRAVAHDAMFALADLMANERALFGDDDRGFGQHLKKHGITVERNELSAMTSWWRRRTQAQRIEAMNYAVEHGIARMVTLRRHFDRMEPAASKTIDVQAHVVTTHRDIDDPEPAPLMGWMDSVLAGCKLPEGISPSDIRKALRVMNETEMPWRLIAALFALVAMNPHLLERTARDLDEGGETLRKLLGKVSK
jgi:hypothetical protein